MKPTPAKEMVSTFETVPGLSSVERVLEIVTLSDGRKAQLTTKLETDESMFVDETPHTSIDHRKNQFITTDGSVRLIVPLSQPTAEEGYPEIEVAED